MTEKEAKERIKKLKKIINEARYAYHVLYKDIYPPEVLDFFKKELFDLEKQYPQFITPDSPTQRIAGEPLKEFSKIRHKVPMLSFNDAFSFSDLLNWQERTSKLLPSGIKIDYFCELKIDGLAIKLIYEKGILKFGVTRGDGYLGEDVTQNIKTIEAIPLSLFSLEEIKKNLKEENLDLTWQYFEKGYPKEIEIRGEVFMHLKDFQILNEERKKNGEPLFANTRNAASGSLRQLDPNITRSRKLDSFAYSLITDLGQKSHSDEHKILKCLGFKTNPLVQICQTLEEIKNFHDYWEKNRSKLSYEIDGIMVIINQNDIFQSLGVVGKAPRAAIAFKFSPKQANTIIEDVIFQTGRTGIISPVAILKPVQIGGVIVSRASLHNEDEIKRLGIKIKDNVIVVRSGDVIPHIEKIIKELRTGKEKRIVFPQKCPSCQSQLIKEGVFWRCLNKNCYALKKEKIIHFVSKPAFDIAGLGEKIIDKLIENNLINNAADLFKLKPGDLRHLSGFDVILENNLLTSINSKKKINLERFIYALGILHIGEENAKNLAKFLTSRGKIEKPLDLIFLTKNLKPIDFNLINNFGEKTIQEVFKWFTDVENIKFLEKLTEMGIKIKNELKINQQLKGKTFVFTGELERYSRSKVEELVKKFGAEVKETVSREVSFLVVGKNPGLKLTKAQNLNVKIMTEEEFYNLIDSLL